MVDTESPASRRKFPWGLTFFGLLAVGGLVSMPILAGEADGREMPDIIRFLGHFHPALLHLPIGVFALILFQELVAIFGKQRRGAAPVSLVPLFFGAASAIVAVIAGFLLYHGDDYVGDQLALRHLWGGLGFAVVAVITLMVKAWTVALSGNPAWYRLLLFGSVGVMGFASHDGATMTHGAGYLTKYAPNPIRLLLGLDPRESAPKSSAPQTPALQVQVVGTVEPAVPDSVYASIISPILERRCVSCHKEGKSKGKLRMETYELLLAGGKEGAAIKPGSAADSNIVFRMELDEDDEEHMPPEGKPPVEIAELQVIKWWLDQGGDPAKALADFEVPKEIGSAIATLASFAPPVSADPAGHPAIAEAAKGPDDALKAAVGKLAEQFPGAVAFESQDSSLVTFTAVSMRGKMDDETFRALAPVMPHLVTVDLSATGITDQSVASLESAKQLRMVRLAETGVTDGAIDTLLKLPALESINFYGTKVTDSGIAKLAGMPNLKRLYLWQTAVTPEAVTALKEKLPGCEIVMGTVSSAEIQ